MVRAPRAGRSFRQAIIAASLLASTGAHAHAFLDGATPRVGSVVAAAPKEVVLTFTQGVEPAFSTIEVAGPSGALVQQGAAHTVGADPARLGVALRPLAAGTYTVTWHATSVDTHKTQGRFRFTVAP